MQSGISSSERKGWFNLTLFKKNVTRFWPIWAIYAAILFFALPVEIILNGGNSSLNYLAENMMVMMVPMGGFFGLVTAMALFSYLMNPRACQLFHALPIRREGLFLTNWLSGLGFFLVPNAVILLISLAASGLLGGPGGGELVLWFIVATVVPMFFFCFAVLCAMFTGHILALPVFYGILNVLVIGVCALLDNAGSELLYNYSGMTLTNSVPARWCTPAYQLFHLLTNWGTQTEGVAAAAGYCIVLGAAFTFLAVGVYRLRQLERAGDLVTVGWVRPVFQFGLGTCVGLLVGLILYWNFFRSFGPWAYIICVAVCAVIGAFAGRMLLKKTLRVFADGWKGCTALGLVLLLLMAGVKVDALGFQRWTPDADKVKAVTISDLYTYPRDNGSYNYVTIDDPAVIQQVVDLHRTLNDHLPELQKSKEEGVETAFDETDNYQIRSGASISFQYEMADGSLVIRRYYGIPIDAQALEDPESYAAKLSALANLPAVEGPTYWDRWDDLPQDLKATGGWINYVEPLPETVEPEEGGSEIVLLEGDTEVAAEQYYDQRSEVQLIGYQPQQLWNAFQEDLEAGRVKRYLLQNKERDENCYYSDITLSLSWTEIDDEGNRHTMTSDVTFTPQKTQTSVMAVLEEMGLKDRLTERGSGKYRE